MKNFYLPIINQCLILYILLFSVFTIGQTPEQKKELLQQYDLSKVKQLQLEFLEKAKIERDRAYTAARVNQWDIFKYNPNGSFDELMSLLPDGSPKYYSVTNLDAAISTRTNQLNSNGGLGLNLNGQGMVGGVWDGGPVRTSHQEFGGRVTVGDGTTQLNNNSFHATHVSGTVGAAGIDIEAKGMAFQASVRTFDWTQDEAEVLGEIQNGLLLSNHSYGVRLSSVPSWYAGAYSQDAVEWDQIHYLSPYYLMVVSAGNDGNSTNADPTTEGFDKLTGNKNCKNNLVIANARDAVIDSNGNLVSVVINSGSSEGPSDDFRIKPDITGNGTSVYSTTSTGNQQYTTLSGTSMSGPNVMGTLLLFQQYYQELYQTFMKASTLKGLACHTADDAGNPGPDAVFGWGLLNAKKAATTIADNGLTTWISEESLTQNQVYTKTVKSVAGESLEATICWTDIPGIANSGILNDNTPVLIHDLDIRITQGQTTFYPWRLSTNANFWAARNGDNFVDTVESIKIDNANGGDYTITISHKGNLLTSNQDFSLIITGIDSDFGFVPLGYNQTVCASQDATFSFALNNPEGNTINLSATSIPDGAIVNFSETILTAGGNFEMSLSNLSAVQPGDYMIGIVAQNSTETETRFVYLKILSSDFELINTISPNNGQINVPSTIRLLWEEDINAENYTVEVASDAAFNSIISTDSTENSFADITDLESQTVYYWRVKPSNRCGNSTSFSVLNFQTGTLNCGFEFVATDFSDATIGNVANSTASIPILVSGGITIADINVSLDVTHTWVQDLTITLIGPPEIGNPAITLLEEPCGGQDDILATLDDSGTILACGTDPAISGIIKPQQTLSELNGNLADGIWTLFIIDKYNTDGGTINAVNLSFCNINPIANSMSILNDGIITEANSSKVILQSELNAFTPSITSNNHVYTLTDLPSFGTLKRENSELQLGDTFTQEELNLNLISYTNSLIEEATDDFTVNILNSAAAWLPNVVIPIVIQNNLDLADNRSQQVTLYPNPSRGSFTVSWFDNLETKIDLFDLQGRIVLSKTTNANSVELDIHEFSDGIYLVSIENESTKLIKKIVLKR